jgi:hypothetical protein
MNAITDITVIGRLRSVLLELARRQDDLAAGEAAGTPYWEPCPSTVLGHRAAAAALRTEADLLLAAS